MLYYSHIDNLKDEYYPNYIIYYVEWLNHIRAINYLLLNDMSRFLYFALQSKNLNKKTI